VFLRFDLSESEAVLKRRDEGEAKRPDVKKVTFVFEAPLFSVDGVPWQDFAEGLVRFAAHTFAWRLIKQEAA
jgi:hypothetical protein